MSYDLAFWHEEQPITAEQALQVYEHLCEGNDTLLKPQPTLAVFLQEIAQHYPPLTLENLEASPWSAEWSVTSGAVIFCMTWSAGPKLATYLIQLAHEQGLVCYDPQQDQVYLPAPLLAKGQQTARDAFSQG